MDEVQEAAIVEANLAALPDDPTAEEVLQAITGFSDDAVNIALKRGGGGGGGGGLPTGWTQEGDPAILSSNGGGLDLGTGNLDNAFISDTNQFADIDMDGNSINNVGSVVLEGSGEIDTNGGDLDLGSGRVMSDLVVVTGKIVDLTNSGGLALIPGTATFLNADQEVPAVATVQDVVDALLNLGLITQAAP